jgi:hypothetical protein
MRRPPARRRTSPGAKGNGTPASSMKRSVQMRRVAQPECKPWSRLTLLHTVGRFAHVSEV